MSVFSNGVLRYDIAQDDNVALVELEFLVDGQKPIGASGSSKRAQGDPRDKTFGLKLAMARAFALLSEKILESEGYVLED